MADKTTLNSISNQIQKLESKVFEKIDSLEKGQNEMKADMSEMKVDIGTLKSDVGTLKSDVKTLKGDVRTLKSEMGGMKSEMGEMKSDIADIKVSQADTNSKLDRLENSFYDFQDAERSEHELTRRTIDQAFQRISYLYDKVEVNKVRSINS